VSKLKIEWICRNCGFRSDFWSRYYWRCPICGSPLEIEYKKSFEPESGRGMIRYSSMLPMKPEKNIGEGDTPLIIENIDGRKILFKLEYLNPGGSFKDRGSSLAVYYAYKTGYKTVVEDTSGNTGISVSLYSRIYGLKTKIFMPKTAPEGKKRLVKKLGAEVVETEDRARASEEVLKYVSESFYVAHTWNYLYVLGASTISYEVYEEYGPPDLVITPIGSGGLFLGLVKGFEELYKLGRISRMPRFIGVQGYNVQPVYEALKGYKEAGEDSSLADGIMVRNPPRLQEIIEKIRLYNGEVILVGNSEIEKALERLLDLGFIIEPTSATVYAAYEKIKNKIDEKTILMPLTGSGLKI
jgi:threonine synthase